MGLPARPACVVRIPRVVYVDEQVTLYVDVTAEKPTKVDRIEVRIIGRQGWRVSNGKNTTSFVRDVPELGKELCGETVLEVGTRTFPLSFRLPHGTAPSHQIAPAFASLLIEVRASIPWWPDGKYRFTVPVRIPPPPAVARTPLVTRHPFEARPGQPRLELSLASTTLAAGEPVVGSVAVFHLADDRARKVELEFTPRVRMHGRARSSERTGAGYSTTVELPAGTAGEAIAFRVSLPAAITPSFKSVTHQIDWIMTATIGSMFTTKLSMSLPLTIVDTRAIATLPQLTVAPNLADERVLAAFQRFAANHGLTVQADADPAFPDEQPSLVRELGDATIRIGYAYRGERGTFLVGHVRYPRLGLGLSVRPSSSLRELFSKDIEIDLAAWDRAHHVSARDAAQVTPFIRASLPGVAAGDLVRWTDDEMVTERGVTAVDEAVLAAVVQSLQGVATAIANTRDSIAPPAGVTVDVAAWRELAERYASELVVGDLSISGTLELQPIDLGLAFDEEGRATAMRLAVGTPQAPDGTPLPERVTSLVAELAAELPDVAVRDGVASASLPLATGTDAARVRDAVRKLRAIVAALGETVGPYR